MAEENYDDFLEELSKRSGASVERSDLDTLRGKAPEDVEAHKQALEVQYGERGANQTGGNATPAQSWNSSGGESSGQASASLYPDWYRDLMTRNIAMQESQAADTKGRADALYSTLDSRAKQGLQVNAQDPIIKGQVEAFGAQGERSRRNYLSDIAERSGPLANIQGERRMSAEKLGQSTGAFQAELMGRELSARRNEIAQALAQQGGMLSGDQTRNLQAQLAQMDQAIAEAGVGLGSRGLDVQSQLGNRGLDLQSQLGNRGLDQSSDQFMRELALREWDLSDQHDWRWAGV